MKINPDSTFQYDFRFDNEHRWSKGKWGIFNDTIYFTVIPISDSIVDSFDVKINEKWERIGIKSTERQDTQTTEKKLYYRNSKLFRIKENGKLNRKKQRGILPIKRRIFGYKKYSVWYIKK